MGHVSHSPCKCNTFDANNRRAIHKSYPNPRKTNNLHRSGGLSEQLPLQVRAVHGCRSRTMAARYSRLVPEEELALLQLLLAGAGRVHRLQRVRVVSRSSKSR